jgi:hypothetical protein
MFLVLLFLIVLVQLIRVNMEGYENPFVNSGSSSQCIVSPSQYSSDFTNWDKQNGIKTNNSLISYYANDNNYKSKRSLLLYQNCLF